MQDTPATSKWTRRTFLGIPLIGWVLLAMAGTAVAAAYFIVTLSATGTISLGDGTDVQFTGTPPVVDTNADCTATVVDGKNINLNASNLVLGDYCEVTVEVENISSGPAVAAAFNGFGMGNDNTVPGFQARWSVWDNTDPNNPIETNVTDCGKEIPAIGTPTTVRVRLDVQWDSVPGAFYDFNTPHDGFMFVPLSAYDDGQCG